MTRRTQCGGYVGWLRLPGGPWRQVAEGTVREDVAGALANAVAQCRAQHVETAVLPADRRPTAMRRRCF